MRFFALYFLMEILVVYCEICTVDEDCKQENDRDKTPSENIWTPEHKSEEINVPLSEGFIDEEGLSKGGIDEENVSKGSINEEGVSKRGIDAEGLSTEDIDEEGVSEGGIDEEDEDMELEMKYIDLAEQYGFQSLIVDGKVKDKDALINALTDADYDELVSSHYPDIKSKKESPLYNLHLTLVYDKELSGVHKENLEEQEKALKLFEADQLLPGDLGTGVLLKEMNSDEKLKRDLMFIDHAFDEYISEIISLNRTLPDRRDPWCYRNEEYLNSLDKLKPTAIIICFCNEAWSTLIRSIFSVLNRSPEHLIDEIILVDDASTLEHLGTKLDEFIKDIPKIKIVRLSERQGLMRSRLAGIRASTADVLTFLDSHIEATEGWLEPLLLQVDKDPKTVASPVIEAIDEKTFQYKFVHHDLTGVFNWKMEFDWAHISEKINGSRTHPWSPYSTPVMAGGLFTINKNWFQRIGLYDEGMEIWGGENLELSFRQWMCGGRIEIVPCSRVGHVYRTYSPYPWRSDINVLVWNPIRVAEVWMDQYKYLYFDRLGNWDLPLNLRLGNFGDVSARKALRDELKCESFQWYLDNIATDVKQHKLLGTGEIYNPRTRRCFDLNDKDENIGKQINTKPCNLQGKNQYWMLSIEGRILRDNNCIGFKDDDIVLNRCFDKWTYDSETRQIYNKQGKCITLTQMNEGLIMSNCNDSDENQQWMFTHYNPSGISYKDLAEPAHL